MTRSAACNRLAASFRVVCTNPYFSTFAELLEKRSPSISSINSSGSRLKDDSNLRGLPVSTTLNLRSWFSIKSGIDSLLKNKMFVKLFLIALPVFFVIDMIWLVLVAKNFYQKQIGFLMSPDINWLAAIIFYLIFIGGLVVFVITPAVEKQSWVHAVLYGAFFGLITYATYDLTNLATLKDWPILVTVVDLIWGSFLAASISIITYFIANKI